MDPVHKTNRPSLAGPDPQGTYALPPRRSAARVFAPLLALVAIFAALLPAPAQAAAPERAAVATSLEVPPYGLPMVLQSVANNRYVTANLSLNQAPLQARAETAAGWEDFYLVPLCYSCSDWAIWSKANGMYVSANLSLPNAPLQARAPQVGAWERFGMWHTPDGHTFFLSLANGMYVSANLSESNAPLQARAQTVGTWEKFRTV